MKNSFILFCLLLSLLSAAAAQTHKVTSLKNYKQLPDTLSRRAKLIKYVIPDKSYTYWEFDEGGMDTTRSGPVLYSSGKKPDGIVIKDPRGSMFRECAPSYCYKYIAYVIDGKVGYITTDKDFIAFLGRIDNLQEAVLLAETQENLYPDQDKRGSGYQITPTGYNLILTLYNLCPETKQAIKVSVGPKGIIKKQPGEVYYKSGDCAVI